MIDPVLAELMSILQKGGPWALAAVFLALFYLSNKERKEAQSSLAELQEKRVEEAQETTRQVTSALCNSTIVLKGHSELIKSLLHRRGGN